MFDQGDHINHDPLGHSLLDTLATLPQLLVPTLLVRAEILEESPIADFIEAASVLRR